VNKTKDTCLDVELIESKKEKVFRNSFPSLQCEENQKQDPCNSETVYHATPEPTLHGTPKPTPRKLRAPYNKQQSSSTSDPTPTKPHSQNLCEQKRSVLPPRIYTYWTSYKTTKKMKDLVAKGRL